MTDVEATEGEATEGEPTEGEPAAADGAAASAAGLVGARAPRSGVQLSVVAAAMGSPHAIERVAEVEEPVLRNLLITQSYHELSRRLAEVVDGSNVNWSTFATWASKTAGRSIRNEEVPKFFLEVLRLEERLERHLPGWLHKVMGKLGLVGRVHQAALATLAEVSEQIAEGNLKVFAELGPVFERFIDVFGKAEGDAALPEFRASLRPGPPEREGQELLRLAFDNYAAAARTTSDKERAELMLLGNCRIGLHEQTRLQGNIQGALDAPIDGIFSKHLRASLPFLLHGPAAALLRFLVRRFTHELTELWQELATRYAMILALPDGKEISLGADVPELPRGASPLLRSFDNPELSALFATYRGTASASAGSAANNWALLEDRMGFIVELFRSRQQELDLLGQPFTAEQRSALASGLIPSGEL